MRDSSKFQYFPCVGEAFIALRQYKAALTALTEDHDAIEKEFNAKAQASQEKHQAVLFDLWKKLSILVGLDPEKTWRNGEYQIETKYMDANFGAVTFEPLPSNPFKEAMLGEVEKKSSPALSDVPNKKDMH